MANDAELSEQEYETRVFAAEIGDAPTVDLHGLTVDLAMHRLDEFIHHELMLGTDVIKIIHGRGGGWLRESVQRQLNELKQKGLVAYFRGAQNPALHNAVTFAALHRIKT